MKVIGTRLEVIRGTAFKTVGGLKKDDLKYSKSGEIVSTKKSDYAKKNENVALKVWRESVQKVNKRSEYSGKFIALKKGTKYYDEVRFEFDFAMGQICLAEKKAEKEEMKKAMAK